MQMLSGGAKNIAANVKLINDLNVFPVPDGDTGTNMSRTFMSGVESALKIQSDSIGAIAKELSHGSLLGARGNSGVILSQILKGIQSEISDKTSLNVIQLLNAYKKGVEQSYHAVVNPVEGTILTVFREAVEYAEKNITEDSSIEDFYKYHIEGAKIVLPKTKEMLPALKEADVIDSGGAGYLFIAEGMFKALSDPDFEPLGNSDVLEMETLPSSDIDISAFTRDSELEFGYCTECLLRLQSSKVDPENFDIQIIIDYLNSIGGESIVAYKEEDIIKLHVHTPNPGFVLTELRKYGEFLTVKIENMALQHQEIINTQNGESKKVKKGEHKKFAVVAVANGNELKKLFTEYGADAIVDGGQTGNPSAQAFIDAFETLDADHILVLPNNSNIVLTAKQAQNLYKKSQVHVLPSKSIQEGYSALMIISPLYDDVESLLEDVNEAMQNVIPCDVALAIRDANIQGQSIKKGQYLGMSKDSIISVGDDKVQTLISLLQGIENISDKEIITLFTGKDITPLEKEEAESLIKKNFKDLELSVIEGNQEVYSFLVSIE